jgi:hypothetical protein
MARRSAVPTEAQEQEALFRWATYSRAKYPALDLLFHVPNGGGRNLIEAAHLKAQGVKPGVPDICLPVPSGRFTALYIELKRKERGRVSDAQRGWIAALNRVGCRAVVCRGWDEARAEIERYLGGRI